MVETVVDIPEQQQVNEIREVFLELMREIPQLDFALPYIPNEITSTCLVMRFVDEEEVESRRAMGKTMIQWVFLVDIYAYGYEQAEMQMRFESIVLQMRRKYRHNRLLGKVIKKRADFVRQGDPTGIEIGGHQVIRQRFRMSVEQEVRP